MGALIPLLLALTIAQFAIDVPASGAVGLPVLVLAAGGPLAVLVLAALARRLQRGAPSLRSVERWDGAGTVAILGWYAWLCLGPCAWSGQTASRTLALAPWVVAMMAHWAGLAPGGLRHRLALCWQATRLELLPVLLVLPVIDLCDLAAVQLGTIAWFHGPYGIVFAAAGSVLLIVGMMAFAPAVLVRLWGARDLEPGPLRDALIATCRRAGVGVGRLMRWPSPGGAHYNAAVLGVVPGLRYVLVTDDLLAASSQRELTAVIGHELGHIRHGHLWTYLAFTVVVSIAILLAMLLLFGNQDHRSGMQLAALGVEWHGLVALLPGASRIDQTWLQLGFLMVLLLIAWRGWFGVVSRRCERQADLHGSAVAEDPTAMRDALRLVARLSGTREDAPGWRHGSIASRVAFLNAVAADPSLADRHHHLVRVTRNLLIYLVALAAAMILALWLDPAFAARRAEDPAPRLAALVEADPELGAALRQADGGDSGSLLRWLNQATSFQRQDLGRLTLMLLPAHDDRVGYRLRQRLAALAALPSGHADLELAIDNALAYFLVAGTREPTANDLAAAAAIQPRLVKAMEAAPDHAVLDTLACLAWVAGRRGEARDRWKQAVELIAGERKGLQPGQPRHDELAAAGELYARRLAVATADAPAPLPLNF